MTYIPETLRQAREALLQSAAALHVIAQSLEGADEPASAPEPKSPPLVSMTDGHGAKLGRKAAREQSRADESDGEKLDPETALLQRVLADAEQAEISAFSAIGVLTTAATMMVSQCYDLTKLGDDHA